MQDAVEQALGMHRAGQLAEAEAIYRQVLAADPTNAPVLHLLGVLAIQAGDHQAAIDLISRAVEIDSTAAAYFCNLGVAYQSTGQIEMAVGCYQQAVDLDPNQVDALNNQAILLRTFGRPEAALAAFERSLEVRPDHPETLNDVGVLLYGLGRLNEAEARLRRALAIAPGYDGALNNLATVLLARGRPDEAVTMARQAVDLNANDARLHDTLGTTLRASGRLEEAIGSYQQALGLAPDVLMTLLNLGGALEAAGRLQPAAVAYRRAAEIYPSSAAALSGLISTLDLVPNAAAEARLQRQRFNILFGQRWRQEPPAYRNDPDPERRLRIGYVSADFRQHSAASVILPILRGHDRSTVEIVCYSGVIAPDAVTAEVRGLAAAWRDVARLADDDLFAQIQADLIDVLVDLSGYSAGNRLPVFGRKPAPIQVTGWGYATGTSLDAVDAFFADAFVVTDETRARLAEEVIAVPSVLPFGPPRDLPPVCSLPALERGAVTLGSLHRMSRLTPEVLDLWARVVAAVPGSRMLLKSPGLGDPSTRERIAAAFARHGVGADRLAFLGLTSRYEHLATYGQVDLHLDTFPQTGGVTTLEGLVMGVPSVTLLGDGVTERISGSFLTILGLDSLVARTPEEYVRAAARAAADLEPLAEQRACLRERLLSSPICDARAYAQAVEAAYRALWRRWCATRAPDAQSSTD